VRFKIQHIAAEKLASAYTPTQHRINQIGVFLYVALCGTGLFRLANVVPAELAWIVGVGAFVGILLSDMFTGFVHWGCDTFGRSDTFFWGRIFIRSFREHHVDPLAITRHDWAQCNGEACLVGIPLTLPLVLFLPGAGSGWVIFFWSLAFFMLVFSALANQFHKWAHQKETPPLVGFLQKTGILMSFRHHQKHHRAPYTKGYCITVGWMNPILDRIGFWRFMENVSMRIWGNLPREDDVGTEGALQIMEHLEMKIPPNVRVQLDAHTSRS